jgi:hypothetical protein
LNVTPTRVNVVGLQVRSEELPGSGQLPAEGFRNVGQDGLLAVLEDDLPRELVAIVNLHTGVGSRSARGYMTLSGPYSEGHLTDKSWAGTYATEGHAFADLLDDSFQLGSIQPAQVNPVVYSRTRRIRQLTPYTFRVTKATFNTRPHWLRSRGTSP